MNLLKKWLEPLEVTTEIGKSLDNIPPYQIIQHVRLTGATAAGASLIPTPGTVLLILDAFANNNTEAAQAYARIHDSSGKTLYIGEAKTASAASRNVDALTGWFKPVVVPHGYQFIIRDWAWSAGEVNQIDIRYLEVIL